MKPVTDLRQGTIAEKLMNHVEQIARYVRYSGDEDEAKAFDYIETCLQEWQVPYERSTHPAYISIPVRASLEVHVDGTTYDIPCITHSMSATTPVGGVEAKVVDVHGGSEEDYHAYGFEAGQFALVDGLATPLKSKIARECGAAGVIFINGEELHEMIISPVWGSPSSETVSSLPNLPVVSVLGKDGARVREHLATAGETQATLCTEVLTEWRKIPILVAELEGGTYSDEVVLLSGHVDSWHYGAMDNASANAVQLEVLRLYKERAAELKRTLRVAFWSGHSHGRYAGSTWYVDNHWRELEKNLVLHMYIDSVGGNGATVLSEAWAMSETKHVAELALAAETGEVFNGTRFGRGGDQSFYGVGASCLFMCLSEQPPAEQSGTVNVSQLLGGNGKTGGLGSWWHAVDDTVDKLNPQFLLRDARIYLHALSVYLEQEKLALDFRPTIREIQTHLETWQAKAGTRFSLEPAIEACVGLQNTIDSVYEQELGDALFNRIAVRLSRFLVPLNYSTGNRFEHDWALAYPPIPALQPVDQLQRSTQGSDEEQHTLVLLRRRLNYVTDTLESAREWIQSTLACS